MEEASGESLKVEMESQQKECDSLRKVTRVSESALGRREGRRDCVLGRNQEFLVLSYPGSSAKELFSLLRSQPFVVNLHFRYSVLSQVDSLSRIYTKVRDTMLIK